jgi:DNA-binding MltR family transcriptional regulator
MKITLAEIKSLETSLSKIFDKDINIKLAYRLGILLKKISEEMQSLEKNRVKLVTKYGVKNGEGQVSVPDEKTPDFYKEFNELMQISIDIDFEPIPLSAFGDISLSAADVMRLDEKIITNDEEIVEKKVLEEVKG